MLSLVANIRCRNELLKPTTLLPRKSRIMAQAPLRGIFTPNIVPLDDHGEINEPELRRYVDWLIDRGVHGLYPNGSTGEFLRFTAEERRRIIEIIVDQTRAGSRSWPEPPRQTHVRRSRPANITANSACAPSLVAPFYYKLTPAGVYAYFKEIADHSPVDITLYNIPLFASPIDVPTLRRLVEECPRIVAIKDSSGDIPHMMRMIQAVRPIRPDFCFLTGWDAALMPMMLIGCDGGTNATSGVVPEITRKLYDLSSHRIHEACNVQYDLVSLFDTMIYSSEFPGRLSRGRESPRLQHGEADGNRCRPSRRLDLATLSRSLQCMLAEHGFTNEPVGGCSDQ